MRYSVWTYSWSAVSIRTGAASYKVDPGVSHLVLFLYAFGAFMGVFK